MSLCNAATQRFKAMGFTQMVCYLDKGHRGDHMNGYCMWPESWVDPPIFPRTEREAVSPQSERSS